MVKPFVPSAYELVVLDRERPAFAHACAVAERRPGDGVLFWTERNDRLEVALLLEPDRPLLPTLEVFHVFALAAGDALGTHTAPAFPLQIRFPHLLIFDIFELARLRCRWPEVAGSQPPPWIVLALQADVAEPEEPGTRPERITLMGAGMEVAETAPIVESLAQYFLHWIARWEEGGFAPIRAAWNLRCENRGRTRTVRFGEREAAGTVEGLDEAGRFVVGGCAISLLDVRSWLEA